MILNQETPPPTREEKAALLEVLRAIRQIHHGYIQVIIQDSKVVQIDRTEKTRLTSQVK